MNTPLKFFTGFIYRKVKAGADLQAAMDRSCPFPKYSVQFRDTVRQQVNHMLENKKLREEKALEPKYHCQICERQHKAPHGYMAHHGYTRPGYGWQTASCYGARHKPWEQSCEAIPPYIETVEAHEKRMELAVKEWMKNPPEKIEIHKPFDVNRAKQPPIVYMRPEGFYAKACMALISVTARTYEAAFRGQINNWHAQRRNAQDEARHMRHRYCSHRLADKQVKYAYQYGASASTASKLAKKGAKR